MLNQFDPEFITFARGRIVDIVRSITGSASIQDLLTEAYMLGMTDSIDFLKMVKREEQANKGP